MSFVTLIYIMFGPIAVIMVGVCIWMNTKSGRRYLGELPYPEEEDTQSRD
jgi:hypothetical protein